MSTNQKQGGARIVYVTDLYCGWCYGFAPKLQEFYEAIGIASRFRW